MYIPGQRTWRRSYRRSVRVQTSGRESTGSNSCLIKCQPIYMYMSTIEKCVCGLILCTCIGKSTKVHLYWAMKNCDSSPEVRLDLRQKIMNTSKHYQVMYIHVHLEFTCTVKFLLRDHDFCLQHY